MLLHCLKFFLSPLLSWKMKLCPTGNVSLVFKELLRFGWHIQKRTIEIVPTHRSCKNNRNQQFIVYVVNLEVPFVLLPSVIKSVSNDTINLKKRKCSKIVWTWFTDLSHNKFTNFSMCRSVSDWTNKTGALVQNIH